MTVDAMDEIKLERSLNDIWTEAQELLKTRVKLPTFKTWIQPLQLQQLDGNEAVIAAANDFTRTWLVTNRVDDISWALSQVLSTDITVRLIVDPALESTQDYTPSIASIVVAPRPQSGPELGNDAQFRNQAANLNPKYTIEAFVVGSHNRFCHSAAMAVAERPGQIYNPLFIYGGVGLGKTHIMQAIGHHVMLNNPRLIVRYITCERFTNDLINSIRTNSMMDFRKRYRQVDVLLVDDIQFIEGKESTQEEFFHTFNALRDSGKQIVVSSDRAPKDIPKLEERLRSRFNGGLIADMQPPDLETRVAILRKKCQTESKELPDAVLEYIASSYTQNIRELEGAVLRVHAYASLTGMALNIQTVASVLQIGAPVSKAHNITIETIIGAVAAHYRVDTSDLRSANRSKDLALPRHIAMYLAHDILSLSHSRIGEAFGNRKHSSVIYAIEKIKTELPKNVQMTQAVQQIRHQLSL